MLIRPADRGDQSYVGSTWTRSLLAQHATERPPGMQNWPQISKRLDATLERRETRVVIAYPEHDRRAILGWLCYADGAGAPLVHYMYVRLTVQTPDGLREVRGKAGIAHALLKHIGVGRDTAVVCTSLGPSSQAMRARYPASSYLPLTEYLGGKP